MADAGRVLLCRSLHRLRIPLALLAGTVLALPTGASAAGPCQDANLTPSSANLTQVRAITLCLINSERTSRGRAPLSSSPPLRKAAHSYSRLMVRDRFFSHVSPSGSTLTSRVRGRTTYLRGARSWALGENIAWGSGALGTPARIVSAWMRSPGHRANILTANFRNIGIGIASGAPRSTGGRSAVTYTADFGRR